jgi:hypothetical protein
VPFQAHWKLGVSPTGSVGQFGSWKWSQSCNDVAAYSGSPQYHSAFEIGVVSEGTGC